MDDNAAKTPLLDLLRSVPSDARAIYEHHAFASSSFPYGRLCAEAAERIAELEREVNEQARLLGISGSVEARLLARVAELERALLVARGALSPIARIGAISAYIIANARTAVDGIDAVMRKERDDAPR